jgi:hypothetical protein
MDQDLQLCPCRIPKSNLTPKECKQNRAEYIKQYYLQNKEKINQNPQ